MNLKLGRLRIGLLGWCACLWMVLPAWAAEYKDHPLLSGVAGFEISEKSEKPFDAVEIKPADISQAKDKPYSGATSFEGRVTRLTYVSKAGVETGIVEVYRNYVAAIEKLGGHALNTPPKGDSLSYSQHVFQVPRPGQAPVTVLLKFPYNAARYYLTIVEPQAMVQSVKAGELAREIAADGWATLYINFDTNKSELKEDGQAAVKEIAALLKQQPTLKLSIEGHTDNVGDAQANRKLSQARAEAVLAAVKAQGIDGKRLAAKGQGADIPIADNRKEEGRAKNRRVELVKLP